MTCSVSTGLLDLELFLFGSTMGAPHGLYSSENHEKKRHLVSYSTSQYNPQSLLKGIP